MPIVPQCERPRKEGFKFKGNLSSEARPYLKRNVKSSMLI